ncbi:MAG TPA: phosphoribosylformylglycinamidine synthase subunit PurQ [Pirellulales bacterium]|nr:phosphoribosylformylglycinamidine synthase subunit PurQ [Pirellulales bacterium]
MQPKILILRAPGTNCDGETAYAFQRAGGQAEIQHVRRALENPRLLNEYQVLCIPGGFSYGDDLSSGRIFGVQLQHHLADALQQFKAAGKLILGVCNGFQILSKCGLLASDDPAHGPAVTLAWNASRKFEDRWVNLAADKSKCVFLAGISQMYLPVAHGEGRFFARNETVLAELIRRGQLPLRYAPQPSSTQNDSGPAITDQPVAYPDNPNGAQANVAGMCDETGHVLGLMPHPERHIDFTQHPRWTRGEAAEVGDGLRLFQNAVQFFR